MTSGKRVSLNADLGEGFGAYTLGDDAALMDVITCANLACGFHGGDPLVIQRALRAAKRRHIAVGAHPSYPDLQGFGRRKMTLSPEEMEAVLSYQISALSGMAARENLPLQHVKPHGALNNMAAEDRDLARLIARTVTSINADLILLAPAGSEMMTAATQTGCRVAAEIFADRAYTDQGTLAARDTPGAVLHDPKAAAGQVLAFLAAGGIIPPSGSLLATPIHSICVHGDTPDAVAMARYIKAQLNAADIALAPLSQLV